MTIMYDRKTNRRYEVYGFDVDHNAALCYDPSAAAKCGQGFIKISTKNLIPEEYYDVAMQGFRSKTERNKIKSKLKMVDAIWECTDGKRYMHIDFEMALAHQTELEEIKKNEES